ncbi:protein immune deficiency [Plodia interpunctella]|uniref:protein immune deficiency n=1 Tax=Plodia interpunctella TaxID=58824 RepID=UPI002368909C|nr:protein immune deficiency [Plodia interpunctella]
MASVTSRFLDLIRRNLKTDAVPRPPRLDSDQNNEAPGESYSPNQNTDPASEESEEILIEDNDENSKSKYDEPKVKGTYFKSKKRKNFRGSEPKIENIDPNEQVQVNTQAGGHVINIVNTVGTHWGNNYVYHLSSKKNDKTIDADSDDEVIQKDDLITLLLEAEEEVDHEYIDFISKNLGRKWRSFFISIGFTRGRIETVEYDEMKNGVSEVRYKLLLDYIRNADDPSLGNLATCLWDEGEREVVKGLSIIYKKNKKKL